MPPETPSPQSAAAPQGKIAGVLLSLMITAFILGDIIGAFDSGGDGRFYLTLCAGVCGWLAAVLLLSQIRKSQQLLISILLMLGIFLMLLVWSRGGPFAIADALSRNAGLLTMIISVGFLKLVALPTVDEESRLPVGKAAFRDTLLSVAVFGSFINISAPVLIADRLSHRRPLDLFSCTSITRIFSGCSAWSPFFGGMAVVLSYVKGVTLAAVMLAGFPFAVVGFALVYVMGVTRHSEAVANFRGFPMQVSSLWVPALLAVIVVLLAKLASQLSILTVIALGGLLITVGTLLWRQGFSGSASSLSEFIANGLPRTANELTLFLAAGVLAVGLTGIVDLGMVSIPEMTFDGNTASLLLILMVLIAMAGIHPVIQVSGFTPLLAAINPDPELLAITYIFAWSLGTCASPISGTHLVMQGRYGIPSWKGAFYNWPYVLLMLLVAIVIVHIAAQMNG